MGAIRYSKAKLTFVSDGEARMFLRKFPETTATFLHKSEALFQGLDLSTRENTTQPRPELYRVVSRLSDIGMFGFEIGRCFRFITP